jgi:hypothetical protein
MLESLGKEREWRFRRSQFRHKLAAKLLRTAGKKALR